MDNFTLEEDGGKFTKFENMVLLVNGCVSLLLSVVICLVNSVLIIVTSRNSPRFKKLSHKIHIAFFYLNLMAGILFLPYFGITQILHGLEVTKTTLLFPSYSSLTLTFFAQTSLQLALFAMAERSIAFGFPHLHRGILTKTKLLVSLLLREGIALVVVCLQFIGLSERIFYTLYIHMLISAPTLGLIIMACITYRDIKNRKRIESAEIPYSVEQLELYRKRNTRVARKYLRMISVYLLPLYLCILPWYIVTIIQTTLNYSLKNGVGFFCQRFSISLLFLPDVAGPITIILRREDYFNSVKRFIRR